MKIRLTESKLKQIVSESVKRIVEGDMMMYNSEGELVPYASSDNYSDVIYRINNGVYDNMLKSMKPMDCEEWVDEMDYEYGRGCRNAALKRALKVNKAYAMWGRRQNKAEGNDTYDDYRSPNFYKGPLSQANVIGKPTPFGMEDFDSQLKYGRQKEHEGRPEVSDYARRYWPEIPHKPTEKNRLYNHLDNLDYYASDIDDKYERAQEDFKIKHYYNGKNPKKDKLHTRGSANRDLMAIDRQRKTANN